MITTRFTFHQPPYNFAPGTLKTFLCLGDSFTRTQEKKETQKNGEWVLLANTQINANPTQYLWHFSEKKVLKLYIVITNNNYRIISFIPVFRRSWVAITAPVCGGGELKVSHKYGFLLYVSHLNKPIYWNKTCFKCSITELWKMLVHTFTVYYILLL